MKSTNPLKALGVLLLSFSVVIFGIPEQSLAAPSVYTVTVAKTPSAGGTVAATDNESNSWAIAATASAEYHFTRWACTRSQTPVSATTASTTVTASANTACTATFTADSAFTVTVAKTPSAGGTVTAIDNGRNSWSISASPSAGYHFTRWACDEDQLPSSVLSASTKVTASADTTCTATFTADSDFTVTVATVSATKGTVTKTDNGSDSWSISATAKTGYHFTSWACTASQTPNSVAKASTKVTASADTTCTATFTANSKFTVTVAKTPSLGGTVSTVDNGSNLWSISATPADGYHFMRWACTPAQTLGSAASATTTLTASAATSCRATFIAESTNIVTVAKTPSAGGTVEAIDNGSNLWEISATANTGYRFTSWACSASQTPNSVVSTATKVTAAVATTCTATFTANSEFTVTAAKTPSAGGSVSATDDGDDSWSISATPSGGYRFVSWACNAGATPDSSSDASTTVAVTAATTCTATFAAIDLEFSDSIDISGFGVKESSLSAARRTEIRDFVESSSGASYVCIGNVTSEAALAGAKVLAKKRATAVCDYISSLDPSALTESEFSVPNRLVDTSVSRRVVIEVYTPA